MSKGLVKGLWRVTWGGIRGVLWDFPKLLIEGAVYAPAATIGYIGHQVDLYNAMGPVERRQYVNAVLDRTASAFEETPFVYPESTAKLSDQVERLIVKHYGKLEAEYQAGDWVGALDAFVTESTEGAANIALTLGPGVLARFPSAARRLEAAKLATQARLESGLASTIAAVNPRALTAISALQNVVKPGFWFSDEQLRKLFGVASEHADAYRRIAKKFKVNIVLRSRAVESLDWLNNKGAVMKPYWIKLKNVSWIDAQYLGYAGDDVGRLIVREPPLWSRVERQLRSEGVKKGSVKWTEVEERWKTRSKEWTDPERRDMWRWHADGTVAGKWPWLENGVDPAVQADSYYPHGFRMAPTGRPGEYAPQIHNPKTGQWASVTGDVDLIAITSADNTNLSDEVHVAVLKAIRDSEVGALHPESATWELNGEWWFKKKENYLLNTNDATGLPECCLAQFGADGNVRAVMWNKTKSFLLKRTGSFYRLFWDGGYVGPPGAAVRGG